MQQNHKQNDIKTALDILWSLHDQAKKNKNSKEVEYYANEAFKLLEKLPENAIYLTTKQ